MIDVQIERATGSDELDYVETNQIRSRLAANWPLYADGEGKRRLPTPSALPARTHSVQSEKHRD